MDLPTYQKATWVDTPGPSAEVYLRHDVNVPVPEEGEVLVKLEFTGVCVELIATSYSDVHKIFGSTPLTTNVVGHEGVGTVVKLGNGVKPNMMGTRVGIKWLYSACNNCEICDVNYTVCPKQQNSGRDVPGTFQQYVVAPVAFTTIIPAGLKSEDVAPLLCAGLTVYSAIKKTNLRRGDWLVITGAGGGSGHYGIQIAKNAGYKVIAIDSGETKRKLSTELGATVFLDHKVQGFEEEVLKLTGGYGAHAVICCPGEDVAYEQAIGMVRNLAGIKNKIEGLTVIGSLVGTEDELVELMEMAGKGEIRSVLEIYEHKELGEVLKKLSKGDITGRAVIRIR